MALATALLVSTIFLIAHALYYPFRTTVCNRLQFLCLSVLTLIYFIGKHTVLTTHAARHTVLTPQDLQGTLYSLHTLQGTLYSHTLHAQVYC
jgi:hypothetical protein